MTYDNHTGTIFVHYTLCFNPCTQFGCVRPVSCGPDFTSRTMYVASNSSFLSWGPVTEISAQLASGRSPIHTFAPGAGEGAQTASGRLVICGYTIDCARGQVKNCTSEAHCQDNCQSSVLILSDDHGRTWRTGARLTDYSAFPTNECDAAVLRNGSVLVSMRTEGDDRRVFARSDDEGETFSVSSIHHQLDLPAPGCQSSMVSAADGTLFLSHPFNSDSRINMTVSVSHDGGNSFGVLANVWPGPSGYNSLTVMPAAFGGPPAVGLLYNRGAAGDGCYSGALRIGACPYSTVVSFAVIPISGAADPNLEPGSPETRDSGDSGLLAVQLTNGSTEQATPAVTSPSADTGEPPLLSLGWWCNSSTFPDLPGLFANHVHIVTTVTLPPCGSGVDCIAACNVSRLLFEPRRCASKTTAGTAPLCPQPLANGSVLHSLYDIVRFGRERWSAQKIIVAEKLDTAWSAMIADASCYADTHRNGSTDSSSRTSCGQVMQAYSHSLCQALDRAQLQWWIFDGEAVYDEHGDARSAARGTAQALRYIRATCAIEFGRSVSFGWTVHGQTGMDSYLFTNVSTWVGWSTTVRVVDLVDYILPRTYGNPLQSHYFSNSRAAHAGECSPGRDEVLMEWISDGPEQYRIPRQKLLMGIGNTHTSYRCDRDLSVTVQPCDAVPSVGCKLSPHWRPSRGDGAAGGTQAEIYRQISSGNMSVRHDRWSQQSYFARSNLECVDCLGYVDSNTAQAWDFQLRQLKWRGVRGYFTACVEDDFVAATASGEAGRHWSQDTNVSTQFQTQSEVFAVSTGAGSKAASGLDISSGDSICRLFGGRFDSLGKEVSCGRGSVPPCVVNCFGRRPASAESAWPFVVAPHNESHWSQLRSPHVDDPRGATQNSEPSFNITAVFQVTTKSMANLSGTPDPERLAAEPSYRREVPITSDAGRILAALLGGVVATTSQVQGVAAAGAHWPQLGLTVQVVSPHENDFYGTAPVDGHLIHNSLQVFDGGIRALGAMNVMPIQPLSGATAARLNGDPTNPFWFRTVAPPPTLKTDDGANHAMAPVDVQAVFAAGNLSWFSIYDFWLNSVYASCKTGPQGQVSQYFKFSQAANVINMPTVCPPSMAEGAVEAKFRTKQWAALNGSRFVLWNVEALGVWYLPCQFVNCAVVARSGLIDGWEKRLDDGTSSIKALPDFAQITVGFFLGDELIQSGIPVANLTAVARRIKLQYALPTMVYTNEDGSCWTTAEGKVPLDGEPCLAAARCAAAGPAGSDARNRGCCMTGPGGTPPELDAVSIDMYSPAEGCGNSSIWAGSGPCNASANLYYCPDPTKEADCLLKYYQTAVYPTLNDKQRAFFVPGLFGPAVDDAADEILTKKFELYWQHVSVLLPPYYYMALHHAFIIC